jgi:large subunit ribosomal protein L18e
VILKRLKQSRIQRYPISLSRVVKQAAKAANKTIVCVCKVLDDERLLVVPKMTVCALKVAESARKRILAAGGEVMTFDQLALRSPNGTNTVTLRGPKSREALRHFGPAPGTPGSHTKPYTRTRHSEIARGR